MKIVPVQPKMSYGINNNSTSNINSVKKNDIKNSNVSFKSITAVLITVAKHGVQVLDQNKKLKYVRGLEDLYVKWFPLSAYGIIDKQEEFLYGYAALAKTPDDFWNGSHSSISSLLADVVFNFRCSVTSSIGHIRDVALKKMGYMDYLGLIDDKNIEHVQIRKDFIRSILNNNHEIGDAFQDVFASLDDGVYKSFKEEVVNTCLYSQGYNANRDYNTKKLNDAMLIHSLNPDKYSSFLKSIKERNW